VHSSESSFEWSAVVAATADVCMKPCLHAVVDERNLSEENNDNKQDLIMRIECRSPEGERLPEKDLELEIFCSGGELNLTLCWHKQLDRPILWHGQYPIWMDGTTGKRCSSPLDGDCLESFARRLRALFDSTND